MATIELSRTLVKSPPELWTELSGDGLRNGLGAERVKPTENERELAWECNGACGTALLEPSGWGTKVTLTAHLEEQVSELEQGAARRGLWTRFIGVHPNGQPHTQSEQFKQRLKRLLDDLGSAHKKPFTAE